MADNKQPPSHLVREAVQRCRGGGVFSAGVRRPPPLRILAVKSLHHTPRLCQHLH